MRHLIGFLLMIAAPAMAQRPASAGRTPCPADQEGAVEQARRAAVARLDKAIALMSHPPAQVRQSYTDQRWRGAVRGKAVQLFDDPEFDLGLGADTLRRMKERLADSPGAPVAVCAARNDRYCRNRDAYVVDASTPIRLCPGFFRYEAGLTPARSLAEKQTRTIIHEAAHLWGIGDPFQEEYCIMFDCATSCGPPRDSADSWAHFVHCLVGLPPDR